MAATFESLSKAVSDKSFDEFMLVLSENIKNLGARIKQLDKKIERKVKDTVQGLLRAHFTPEALENPLLDYKKTLTAILNFKLSDCGCYLGLPSEEWAVKIMTNLLINGHVETEPPISEKMREDLIQAQALFVQVEDSGKALALLKCLIE